MGKNKYTQMMILGAIAGLIATFMMDIFVVAYFLIADIPVELIYSFIGKVTANFFLLFGMNIPGGIPTGAFVHYFLGAGLGAVFSVGVTYFNRLHLGTITKGILLGILFIEIASQPFLAAAPLLVKMETPDIVEWYLLSFLMHMIYGGILGLIVTKRPLLSNSTGDRPS